MEYKDIIQELIKFRNDREWNQYHTLISLSRALNIEASEVEKIFLWKKNDNSLSSGDKENLKLELADVLIYCYYMCEKLQVEPNDIIQEKININKGRSWNFDK
ncbi:nucleotide pyrophosphohydrolase [Apilactobacillus kunkeei]|uniref:nucleotide pyrophosphohydrolase n=1 Tax=Apilactobacillus kunkeei TaxID=148814 RepID=UPI0040333206